MVKMVCFISYRLYRIHKAYYIHHVVYIPSWLHTNTQGEIA